MKNLAGLVDQTHGVGATDNILISVDADLLHRTANSMLVVDRGLRVNFPSDHDHLVPGGSFTTALLVKSRRDGAGKVQRTLCS